MPDSGDDGSPDGTTDGAEGGSGDGSTDGTVDGGSSDGGSDGGSGDGASDAGLGCPFDAGQAPDGASVCGDGWRDPSTEECDDGLGDAGVRRGCTDGCQVLDELAVEQIVDGGLSNSPRTIGVGRHPIAASDTTFAVAYLEPSSQPLTLSLATFTSKAAATGVINPFTTQSTVVLDSNPVLAALPCDRYAVAWSDFGGDGDELGVAIRVIDPNVVPQNKPPFANAGWQFSQFDPDILWTGSEIVVAWVDDSNPATQPDVRYQTFDTNLKPMNVGADGGAVDQTLAATADSEADVALATFAGSWAAAWRSDSGGLETVRVHAGSVDWTIGPAFLPAPAAAKPAIAQLDGTHLLAVYAVGVDASDSGVASGSKIQAAVLDVGAPGNVSGVDVPAMALGDGGTSALSQGQPNAVTVDGKTFIAWWTQAAQGDPLGEELWLKAVGWNGAQIDLSTAEIPLPRWMQARAGDQRAPALAASALLPQGALVMAWDDLGKGIAAGEGNGDVVGQFAPVPLLRAAGDGGP